MTIFEPETWEKPTPKQMSHFMDRPKVTQNGPTGSILAFRKHLSPLDVYKYLVARFGLPYGFQTFVKKPYDSDNLIHWDYLIKSGPDMIWIQGGNRDVQVYISGRTMSPKDWVQFCIAMKGDFGRCSAEMAKVGATFEKWSIVSNRFAMTADACAEFHDVLTREADAPDFAAHKRTTERGIRRYYRQIKRLGERANRVFTASLSLDMITPVLAEAFVNFVILITRKDELILNPRQYDHYIRQPIDTRVFDLHLKCNNFMGGIDPQGKEFKAFKKVMDRRNYNLHGNIDPGRDAIDTVYFDKFTPLYADGADPILDLFRKKETTFDIRGVIGRYEDVHSFFHYVLGLIEAKARADIELLMSDDTFGYDAARHRPGRLFSSREVMMIQPLKYDDELKVEWR